MAVVVIHLPVGVHKNLLVQSQDSLLRILISDLIAASPSWSLGNAWNKDSETRGGFIGGSLCCLLMCNRPTPWPPSPSPPPSPTTSCTPARPQPRGLMRVATREVVCLFGGAGGPAGRSCWPTTQEAQGPGPQRFTQQGRNSSPPGARFSSYHSHRPAHLVREGIDGRRRGIDQSEVWMLVNWKSEVDPSTR